MKHTKRMLAIVLTFALTLSLAMPAMAAKFNWDNFYVTQQPKSQTIKDGEGFSLSAAANIPEGVTEVTYQWSYRHAGASKDIEGATTPALEVGSDDPWYPQYSFFQNTKYAGGVNTSYTCEITAYVKDDDGNVTASKFVNAYCTVRLERGILEKLFDLFLAPFAFGGGAVVALSSMTMGILIPFAPVIFLGGLVFGVVFGIQGLFE